MAKKTSSKRTISKKQPSENSSENFPPRPLRELEGLVGQFMEYWGFKNIHGRIWTHLYTSKVPLDSAELMDRLGVSKGLMSLAIRDLLEYEVIKNDHVGKHGTVFFVANPDLFAVITNVLRIRETKMLSQTQKACRTLKELKEQDLEKSKLDKERIQAVLDLTESAQTLLQTFLIQENPPPEGLDFNQILHPSN